MIRHPLIPIIENLDEKLNDLVKNQKELHYAALMKMTTKEQNEQIYEIDKMITDTVNHRNRAQEILFAETRLVILHDWEWDQ